METLSEDALKAIKARWAAATPGPWAHTSGATKHYIESEDGDLSFSLQEFHPSDGHEWPCAATASAIANAPTDIAALVAEVERLWAERQPVAVFDAPIRVYPPERGRPMPFDPFDDQEGR